jgi:hypothetical protein
VLLAACDEELLGRTFSEGKLKLLVDERFYGGELVDEATLGDSLSLATMANLVGERTVRTALEAGYIDEGCSMMLEGVPHAQMVIMH